MLKSILPKELQKTKIQYVDEENLARCNDEENIIYLNRRIFYILDSKQKTELFLNQKLSYKDFILFVLLHELGHRFEYIHKTFNQLKYQSQKQKFIDSNYFPSQQRVLYWTEIEEEKKAMDFAKLYFKKYQEKRNKTNV